MSPLVAGIGLVSLLYAGRIGLRIAQRMGSGTVGAGYAKGAAGEFMNHLGPFDEAVSVHEARLILGLEVGASKEEIKRTHRALIIRNHADKGGSPYIARKINESRDILLGPGVK